MEDRAGTGLLLASLTWGLSSYLIELFFGDISSYRVEGLRDLRLPFIKLNTFSKEFFILNRRILKIVGKKQLLLFQASFKYYFGAPEKVKRISS
jgi:hypothetical protein